MAKNTSRRKQAPVITTPPTAGQGMNVPAQGHIANQQDQPQSLGAGDNEPSTLQDLAAPQAEALGTPLVDDGATKEDASNEQEGDDNAPAQSPIPAKGGAKKRQKSVIEDWNIKHIGHDEATKRPIPTTDLVVGTVTIDGQAFPVIIKPPKPFPGIIGDDKEQRAWDRLSSARETLKDLVERAEQFGINLKTYSLVQKLLSENMATWLGNDCSFENPNVLSDHVTNGKHVQAQLCKKYLTGQALLDALKDLEPHLSHHMLKDLSPEERVHVMGWKEDKKKRKTQTTSQKPPAKKAKKHTSIANR